MKQRPHLGEPEQTLAPGNRLIGLHLVGDELGANLLGQPTADIEHPVACTEVRGVTASVAIARCKLLTSA